MKLIKTKKNKKEKNKNIEPSLDLSKEISDTDKQLTNEERQMRVQNLMFNDVVNKKEEDIELEELLYSDEPPYELFENFPSSIQKQIKMYILFALGFTCVSCASIILGYVNIYIFIPLLIILFFLLYRGFVLYETVRKKDYTIFSGVIISCKKSAFGIFKNSPKSIVQISDGNKTLSCAITQRKVMEGNLITLFIEKDEPIQQSDDGPFIKKYLSISFSAKNVEDLDDYISQEKVVSAEDYINSED